MIKSSSSRQIKVAVQRTGLSIEAALPILEALSHKMFKMYPSLYNTRSVNEFLSDCVYNVMKARPSGLTYLQQFNPGKQKNQAVFLLRSVNNLALDILRSYTSSRKYIVFEHQLNKYQEDTETIPYYDLIPSDYDTASETLLSEILSVLPKASNHQPVYIKDIGHVCYCQYWVMYMYVSGYEITDIANEFKVSTTAVTNTINNARKALKDSI